MSYVYIFIGGGLGSVIRFLISKKLNYADINENFWPIGTFTINIISCFILGYILKWMQLHHSQTHHHLFFIVGLCGGMSTFSTLIYEMFQFFSKGNIATGILYSIISVLSGLMAIYAALKM
ncbi:MAG: fluoride efflux transporter CrcB [Saprospiraceae bacterium]